MSDKNNSVNKSFFLKVLLIVVVLIFLPLILIVGIIYYVWGFILLVAIWINWVLQVRYILFVYSTSPMLSNYIEKEIITRIQDKVVILNWSERKHWKLSLSVLAFRYFGGNKRFKAFAVVFKPFQLNKTFRFYEA